LVTWEGRETRPPRWRLTASDLLLTPEPLHGAVALRTRLNRLLEGLRQYYWVSGLLRGGL